ncbi:hypothetical protein [Limnoglobus roseus]|uniref:Uncharacterized protein n=1 Tax=Limnoglobus roseus TaxID=2598579 RepID=A0A5C1AE95_9BACT|nr:hypothetical protein [Limnoglobus roseus]QEL17561.1 hypothetical protein PX52LOC_04556 [Limnoglobus roseus]
MPRSRDDDYDDDRRDDFEPRRPVKSSVTGMHVILAGIAAGLVAALVGGGIWMAGKEHKPAVQYGNNPLIDAAEKQYQNILEEERAKQGR